MGDERERDGDERCGGEPVRQGVVGAAHQPGEAADERVVQRRIGPGGRGHLDPLVAAARRGGTRAVERRVVSVARGVARAERRGHGDGPVPGRETGGRAAEHVAVGHCVRGSTCAGSSAPPYLAVAAAQQQSNARRPSPIATDEPARRVPLRAGPATVSGRASGTASITGGDDRAPVSGRPRTAA
ncbi:MAG: hypothetical protein V9G12_25920 [Microthrixaceae bacterium]